MEIRKGSWHYRLSRWANGPKLVEVCPSCGAEVEPRRWVSKYQLKEPQSICGYAQSVIVSIVKIVLLGIGASILGILIGAAAVFVASEPMQIMSAIVAFISDPEAIAWAVALVVGLYLIFYIPNDKRISGWFYEYVHALRQRVCIPVKYSDDS